MHSATTRPYHGLNNQSASTYSSCVVMWRINPEQHFIHHSVVQNIDLWQGLEVFEEGAGATSVFQLSRGPTEQGPTEPHVGRSASLPSGAGGEYY